MVLNSTVRAAAWFYCAEVKDVGRGQSLVMVFRKRLLTVGAVSPIENPSNVKGGGSHHRLFLLLSLPLRPSSP